MDGLTAWLLANGYTDEIATGIKSVTNSGSSLIFTTTSETQITVPITGLSDENFTTELKTKIELMDESVLNLFTYSSGTLYFNSNAIATASSVTSVANELNNLNTTTTNHINNTANPHNDKISNMMDALIVSPTGSQILQYNATTKRWINADPSASVKDEMVKATASGDSNYLDAIVDGSTCTIENDKLVITSIKNLTSTAIELNTLTGMTENVKVKLDALASAGMSYKGTVETKTELLALTDMTNGNVRIVKIDESNSNKRITYIYDGSAWQSVGEFNIVIRDLSVDKVDLTSEVKNILPLENIDSSTLLKQTDVIDNLISTNVDKPLSANQGKVLQTAIDSKQNATYVQSTMPTGALILNDIWLNDTDSSNVIMYYYNGTTWIKVGKSGFSIDAWVSNTSYTVGIYVINNSLLYKCSIAHTSGTTFDSANWNLIGGDVTKTYLETIIDKIYPVGHILMTENSANPNTYLGVGTWVAYGQGRVPIGIDTSQTEFNTIGQIGGAKTHTLTIPELPKHSHTYVDRGNGAFNRGDWGNVTDVADNTNGNYTTGLTGGDGSHNNLQPYIVCYMWRRTV